ncbi:MAG: zinc-binding dehydrogenase [Bacteroidales bacterium]|nr:zinc-binding dehydrogenase [Bacteroidales bacterium]
MKKIVLPEYNTNVLRAVLSLRVEEAPIPKPKENQVLIKVHAAPCNPSDIAFLTGGYNVVKNVPAVPGFEGSGIVTEAGEGAEEYFGKKVSFFTQQNEDGSWAEYVCTHKSDLVVLDDKMDMDQAACFAINPFTARGLLDIALLQNTPAIIQNAAGSQVTHFIRLMASELDVKVIDIVRKEETAKKLKKQGAQHILLEDDPDFDMKLKKLSLKLDARLAFDAVAGSFAGRLINAIPEGSELVVYGGLSNKPVSDVNPLGLIFHDKVISGFNLGSWRQLLDDEYFEEISKELQEHFISGAYQTTIQGKTSFDEVSKGLSAYLKNMSEGKMLISPE